MPGITSEQILYGPDGAQYATYATLPLGTQRLPLGTQLVMQDGRKYRFSRAGGSALVVGNTLQAEAVTTEVNLTPAAAAVGDALITLTSVSTEAANFFAEGYIGVSVTPGAGQSWKVLSHLLLTSGAGDIINLATAGFEIAGTRYGGVRTALTTTSRVDLISHPYKGLIQLPVTTLTSIPVGVAVSAIALSGCGWVATRGTHWVLTNGTLIIGEPATVPPTGAGGATSPYAGGAAETGVSIGTVLRVGASTAWSPIFLTIDG